ncbi:hypothetical protein ACWEPC_08400 [Nonomuraea sp. NPDC004297]
MHVGRPAVRALRATAFTAICILASAVLHLLVGGTAIRPDALAVAVAATWAGAYTVGYRPRGRPTLLALCGLSQYGMHRLFATQEYTASTLTLPDAAGSHGHSTGSGMLLIHVAVALGSSWWLARGETALAALLHLGTVGTSALRNLLAYALAAPARVPAGRPPARLPAWPVRARLLPALLVRCLSRRGPPASLPCG